MPGDSLFGRPFTKGTMCEYNGAYCNCYWDLGGLINNLTVRSMNITSFASDGSTINDIYTSQLNRALSLAPQAILLVWDSDASSDGSTHGSPTAAFNSTLIATINAILAKGIKLAIASPEILGENELVPLNPASNTVKLNNYRSVTQAIISKYNNGSNNNGMIPYMDIRQAFLDEISAVGYCDLNFANLCVNGSATGAFYQTCGAGVVTVDGEHPNQRGAELMAALYANVLNSWFPRL